MSEMFWREANRMITNQHSIGGKITESRVNGSQSQSEKLIIPWFDVCCFIANQKIEENALHGKEKKGRENAKRSGTIFRTKE